jgi:hypothetical protein
MTEQKGFDHPHILSRKCLDTWHARIDCYGFFHDKHVLFIVYMWSFPNMVSLQINHPAFLGYTPILLKERHRFTVREIPATGISRTNGLV